MWPTWRWRPLSQPDADPLSLLSPRERQIILMVVEGQSSAAIGTTLHLSPKTVATYRSRLMKKLDVTDVPSLVRLAVRYKLIDVDDPARRNRHRSDLETLRDRSSALSSTFQACGTVPVQLPSPN